MAGGAPGVLETPSYVCAAVFAVFLLVSLLLEKVIHKLQHILSHWKRKGLKTAFDHVVLELMLLGFISLVLLVFQDNITSICVPEHKPPGSWVLINHIDKCHPCLKNTKTISAIYKEKHQCPFWESHKDYSHGTHEENGAHKDMKKDHGTGHGDALGEPHEEPQEELHDEGCKRKGVELVDGVGYSQDHAYEDSYHDEDFGAGHGRRLLAGGEQATVCGKGYEPLVTATVLHEIHIFIFLMGVVHVTTCAVMIILSSWRMRVCGRLVEEEDRHKKRVVMHIQSTVDGGEVVEMSSRMLERRLRNLDRTQTLDSEDRRRLDHWTAPDRDLTLHHNTSLEYFISFFKQFLKPVSKEEFHIMRASFMLTHRRTVNFDFTEYITTALDDDFVEVVKITLSRGITVILFILFLPPIDWSTWQSNGILFAPLMLPLVVNTKLCFIVRRATRGGRVHMLDTSAFWLGRPQLLLSVINFMLFTVSLIFTTLVFFFWQFGAQSCVFYGTSKNGKRNSHITAQDWTLALCLLINFGALLMLSLVTLPTYSLVVNMGGSHWHKSLLPSNVQAKVLDLAKKVKKNKHKNGEVEEEEDVEAASEEQHEIAPIQENYVYTNPAFAT